MRANPEKTLHEIRAIGYTDVELLWSFKNFDRSVKQVRDTLKAEGLKAPSAHMGPETILTEWETRLDEAKQLGHQYLIVPGQFQRDQQVDRRMEAVGASLQCGR